MKTWTKLFYSTLIGVICLIVSGTLAFADESSTLHGNSEEEPVAVTMEEAIKIVGEQDKAAGARSAGDIKGAISALAKGFKERADYVELSTFDITLDEAIGAVNEVIDEYPYYVFDEGGSQYWYYPGTGLMAHFEIRFVHDDDEYPAAKARLDAKISEALSWTSMAFSEWDRAKALHDWIVRNVCYDLEGAYSEHIPATSANAYGPLVLGKGACQGYTRAYDLLLDCAGIESRIVGSESMNHTWNQIEIYGMGGNVDCTWDDPVNTTTGEDGGYWDAPSSWYFFVSDAAFQSDRNHYGYESKLDCSTTKYDYWGWISYEGSLPPNYRFDDVSPTDWYVNSGALHWSMESTIMTGYSEDHFGPYDPMTRAQFIKILWTTFDPDNAHYYRYGTAADTTGQPDAVDYTWWTAAMNWASRNGIVSGLLRPDDIVTREEAFTLLSRAIEWKTGSKPPLTASAISRFHTFKDRDLVSNWARDEVTRIVGAGIVNGSNGNINPRSPLARCEGMQVLCTTASLGFAG